MILAPHFKQCIWVPMQALMGNKNEGAKNSLLFTSPTAAEASNANYTHSLFLYSYI